MKREFIVNRQGQDMVLYKGLLDAIHDQIQSLRVVVTQAPTAENNHTTIAAAELILKDGRVFAEQGDANPDNVGKNIAVHSLRMACTRAKARCMRDALNVGAVAMEELGEVDEPPARLRVMTPPTALASPDQVARLRELALAKNGWDAAALDEHIAAEPRYGSESAATLPAPRVAQMIATFEKKP